MHQIDVEIHSTYFRINKELIDGNNRIPFKFEKIELRIA